MGKLWQKDYTLDSLVESFTVGRDPLLDRSLLAADCVASMAHAEMLGAIGLLGKEEYRDIIRELLALIETSERGEIEISPDEEDCHTAIENRLTASLGESGKRIHAGRSRNDQVIAALRLYIRDFLLTFQSECLHLVSTLLDAAERNVRLPMPGRTHMQIAMPSSVGLWLASFAEELLDDLLHAETAYRLNNQCPLGAAASYGVPLPLDRERVARSLGFPSVQNNVLYVNNSRGKFEAAVLDAGGAVMLTLSRLAQDLMIFSMPEFGYVSLPDEICTGSSIMPQKRNPDVLELVRAKTAAVLSQAHQIKTVLRGLPSGYNRDVQETKAPLMEGAQTALAAVRVMGIVLEKLTFHRDRLLAGFTPQIYATDRALELVSGGKSFREAYHEVSAHLKELESMDPERAVAAKSYPGAPGNPALDIARDRASAHASRLDAEQARVRSSIEKLIGRPLELFSTS